MKKKDEKLADLRLKQLGVIPKIYHFEIPVLPFRTITIADDLLSWNDLRTIIDDILYHTLLTIRYDRSTLMKKGLHEKGIYGLAICERRDPLNRQRGRTIAKGRLWKHLREIGNE